MLVIQIGRVEIRKQYLLLVDSGWGGGGIKEEGIYFPKPKIKYRKEEDNQ